MLKYMLRFVVLLHETPPDYPRKSHFDLMLQREGVLWTWTLDELPQAGQPALAERLPDHRLLYLDYEGEVAGDRGRVSRVDGGEFDLLAEGESYLEVVLRGETLRGRLKLDRLEGEPQRWRISLAAGEAASSVD